MADNYSSVFSVKNFSVNNNLRFKYSMPSSASSRVGSHYSRALSVIPYSNHVDSPSIKSPLLSPSSSSSRSSSLLARHYSSPLPSLSVTTTESLLLKSSLISPGSSRATRYGRSSSSGIMAGGATSTVEVQRISSNSYALLSGGGSASHSPTSSTVSSSVASQRSPLTMFPIVSKSLLRYRHTFSRPSSSISRRCGSVDPEIYRRISVSRHRSNYSALSPSPSTTADLRASSRSRSHSASCSNSRSSSMDRYVNRNIAGTVTSNGNDHLLKVATSPTTALNKDTRRTYSRESSYSAASSSNVIESDNYPKQKTDHTLTGPENTHQNHQISSDGKPYPCVTELARNVASHQWESKERLTNCEEGETGDICFTANKRNGSVDPISINDNTNNSQEDGNNDSGIQGKSTMSRQSSVVSSPSDTDFDTYSTTTVIPPPPPLPPLTTLNDNDIYHNVGNLLLTPAKLAITERNDFATIPVPETTGSLSNHNNDVHIHKPSVTATRTKIAHNTTTTVGKHFTTTTASTDIIDMKFVNGFVQLMNNGTNYESYDRISSPSKSTRQRIRIAKLQNKYGVFKSWLTPEDEQTLARVRETFLICFMGAYISFHTIEC